MSLRFAITRQPMQPYVCRTIAILIVLYSLAAKANDSIISKFDIVLSGEYQHEASCSQLLERALGEGLPLIPKQTKAFLESLHVPSRFKPDRTLKVSPAALLEQIRYLRSIWKNSNSPDEDKQEKLFSTLRLAMRMERARLEYYNLPSSDEMKAELTQLRDLIIDHQRYVRFIDPSRRIEAFVAHGASVNILYILAQMADKHYSVPERLGLLRDLNFEMLGLVDDDVESLLNWNDSPWAPIFFAQVAPLAIEGILKLRGEILRSKSVDYLTDAVIAGALAGILGHIKRLKRLAANETLVPEFMAQSMERISALQKDIHFRALSIRFPELIAP